MLSINTTKKHIYHPELFLISDLSQTKKRIGYLQQPVVEFYSTIGLILNGPYICIGCTFFGLILFPMAVVVSKSG